MPGETGVKRLKIFNHRVHTVAGDVVMTNEGELVCKKAVGAATAVTLPPAPTRGQHVWIKDGNGDANTYNITISGAAAATIDGGSTLVLSANYAYVHLSFNGTEWNVVSNGTQTSGAPTYTGLTVTGPASITPTKSVTSATSAVLNAFTVPATTITVTGTTQITTATGFNFEAIAAPTYTDSSAVTIDRGATLYIGGAPIAAGSVTLTAGYALWVDSGSVRFDGAIDLSAGANTIIVKTATAAALGVTDGTTVMWAADTRTTTSGGGGVTLLGQPVSLTSAGSALTAPTLTLAAKTATLTGTTTTTSLLGVALNVGIQTITDASACTLTTASQVHIAQLAAAGGSLTITNSRMISTGVSDCFLTNAGVWTDTACWASGKKYLTRTARKARRAVERVMEQIQPATWKYRKTMQGTAIDDRNRERVGIVYDDLPEELRAPGEERAVSAGLLSSFTLAALKVLWEENRQLKERLARLESA